MLAVLHIENLAVVKKLDLELSGGFTVLTGETGAGKSMILDAVHLLLGEKVSKDCIRTGENFAYVSAIFSDLDARTVQMLAQLGVAPDEDGNLFLERTLHTDGKAQTRLCGRLIPTSLQKEIGALLINIHGQHDSYALLQPQKHLGFLDAYAKVDDVLQTYQGAYDALKKTKFELERLRRISSEKSDRAEMLRFRIAEIDAAKLKVGEEALLDATCRKIQNSEKIRRQAHTVYAALAVNEKGASVCDLLEIAQQALKQMIPSFPKAQMYSEKLESYRCELLDIAETVHGSADSGFENPEQLLDKIENRLAFLQRLERKYGATVEAVLEAREQAKAELQKMENADSEIERLEEQLQAQTEVARHAADCLRTLRTEAARQLSKRVMEELAFLDMGKVRFSVEIQPLEFTPNGTEQVEFLIATNPGEPLRPLAKIASGGELSRIMLALKSVLAGSDAVQTLIFDEIDAGISGKTSQKVGLKLRHTAQNGIQVLCVTHAAQIAALAHTHFLIEKREQDGRSETTVRALEKEGRVSELARIMGGMNLTKTLKDSARELLMQSQQM